MKQTLNYLATLAPKTQECVFTLQVQKLMGHIICMSGVKGHSEIVLCHSFFIEEHLEEKEEV